MGGSDGLLGFLPLSLEVDLTSRGKHQTMPKIHEPALL
jgi:hypothetical protein